MAVTEFGGGVAQLRGSIGGTTFTRTKTGAITRNRVKPTNPQTVYQTDQRSIITELSQAWGQTLTEAQREGWSTFGVNFPSTNKIGQAMNLSGVQAFQRIGARLMAAGEDYLAAAPANQDVVELQTITLTADIGAGAFEVAFTETGTLTTAKLVVEMTPGISPGISAYQNRLRQILVTAADPTSPIDLETAFAARFGALPLVGQKVAVRCHFIETTTGAVSSPLSATAIVVSTV
jgi:hypothetical protein